MPLVCLKMKEESTKPLKLADIYCLFTAFLLKKLTFFAKTADISPFLAYTIYVNKYVDNKF